MSDYMKLESEHGMDGVTMRVHRFVEKRMFSRLIATAPDKEPQYIVEGRDVYQLEVELNGGDVLLEPGALQFHHGQISSSVIRHEEKGFLARAIASSGTGEAAHATRFTGQGTVWCEPGRRHFVLGTMESDSDAMLLDDRAFYACSGDIKLSTHRHSSVAGLFSGNGLVQPKLTGRGVFAVESPVPENEIKIIELDGTDELVVNGDFMLMYSASLNVNIGPLVSGIRNTMRSGEGFVYRMTGKGTVFLMPTAKVS
ncbi:AIM24 family protein [Sphingomonas sp. VNH70]|uniref:AIM24 family protein n=1 Tax=Sphingomonas silueang TaxID=3156617 RepID=UPI0032B5EE88